MHISHSLSLFFFCCFSLAVLLGFSFSNYHNRIFSLFRYPPDPIDRIGDRCLGWMSCCCDPIVFLCPPRVQCIHLPPCTANVSSRTLSDLLIRAFLLASLCDLIGKKNAKKYIKMYNRRPIMKEERKKERYLILPRCCPAVTSNASHFAFPPRHTRNYIYKYTYSCRQRQAREAKRSRLFSTHLLSPRR